MSPPWLTLYFPLPLFLDTLAVLHVISLWFTFYNALAQRTQGIGMTWAEPPAAGADFPGHLRRRGCGTAAGSPSRTPGVDDGHGSAA